jgi:hypothetical protein
LGSSTKKGEKMSYMRKLIAVMKEHNLPTTMKYVEVTNEVCPICEERELLLIDKRIYWCKVCEWKKIKNIS